MANEELTNAEKLEIYEYAKTLTGRCDRHPQGRKWRWSARWKERSFRVEAIYTDRGRLISYTVEELCSHDLQKTDRGYLYQCTKCREEFVL